MYPKFTRSSNEAENYNAKNVAQPKSHEKSENNTQKGGIEC